MRYVQSGRVRRWLVLAMLLVTIAAPLALRVGVLIILGLALTEA